MALEVPAQTGRITASFDSDWRFFKGDPKQAETAAFNDSAWRLLSMPHDWSIEGPFSEKNATGGAGAFLPAGVGWYHKRFTLPIDYAQRRVFLDFDGVMANSEVWINGTNVAKRPNGYIGFRCELTGRLVFGPGKTNLVAVRADTSRQPASRYYAGAGIYRHTRLVVTEPVHFTQWGIFVTTPKISTDHAVIHLKTTVINQSSAPRNVKVEIDVFGPGGQIVQTTDSRPQIIPGNKTVELQQEFSILKPLLWDCERPNLYTLAVKLRSGNVTLDSEIEVFGIREIRFDAMTGFSLNGRPVKIKGVCLHQDGGAMGAAVPMRVWDYRLGQLKAIGCNAIRTCHNPFAPEFLDLCDRMGFLVVDEAFDCWTVGKMPFDYHRAFKEWAKTDLRDFVCRDRNHPSVILYSIGNEIRDSARNEQAKTTLAMLRDICHQNDPTRPVTQALFRPAANKDYKNGLADLLDVIGQNYRETELFTAFAAKPTRKILSTETGHDHKSWQNVRDAGPCAGTFVWSGVDYLGDSHSKWPWVGAGCGLLDRTGLPRPLAMERRSWWTQTPMVYIVRTTGAAHSNSEDEDAAESIHPRQTEWADWSPRNTKPHDETVEVFGNCQEVELFLNGKSLGTKTRSQDESPIRWKVPFEPGIIKAIGKNMGQPVAGHELRSAGAAVGIALSANRSPLTTEWDDVSCVRAIIVDKDGIPVPTASAKISFKVTGPGVIVAVDSADNTSHEPFQASERRTYNGQCVAYIKATASEAPIVINASAQGLNSPSITIDTVSYAPKTP